MANRPITSTGIVPLNVINPRFNPEMDKERQNAEVIAQISRLQRPDNIIMVTHHLNIEALTGESTGEGDGVVVGYDQTNRKLVVVGRLEFR